MVGEAFLQLLRNPIWGGGIIKAPKIINLKNNKTMTKKFIAILATLPMATLGMAGFAMADVVVVSNSNSAMVVNQVMTGANSGGNTANGGSAGDAGNGGSVLGGDNDNNATGNGGAAGNGGNGRSVTTSPAIATTDIVNNINTNDTVVDLCGCDDPEHQGGDHGFTKVKNRNNANVVNDALTGADSGYNAADGGTAGDGGKGGKVVGHDNDHNTTGNGGA